MTAALPEEAAALVAEDAAKAEEVLMKFERPLERTIEWVGDNMQGLMIGAIVATAIVLAMLFVRMLGRRYCRHHRGVDDWRGIIASVASRTTIIFMIVTAAYVVIAHTEVPDTLYRIFRIAFIVATALQGAIWARELVLGIISSKVAEDAEHESTLANALSLIRVLVSVAVFAIAIIVILDNLGVNVTTLVAGLGIGGIAIGLAAQGIFSDLFAALSIVFDRPFRRGDTISYGGSGGVGGTTGTVEKIGLKTTRIRSVNGEQVIMANTKLLEQEVQNIARAQTRRRAIPFGLVYQTPPEKLKEVPDIVRKAVEPHKEIDIVRIVCTGFGDSSVNFELVYDHRSSDYQHVLGIQGEIVISILDLFNQNDLEFAYPTQTTFTAAPDGTMIMPYPEVMPVHEIEPSGSDGGPQG